MRGGRLRPRSDREAMPLQALKEAERALLIGMGGGGDVVGALAVSDLLEALETDWVLGGIAWERSPIDPRPGPRSLDEIRGGRRCGSAAVLTEGGTTSVDGVEFSESRMARQIGKQTLLLDINAGPHAVAVGLAEAATELGCDAIVLLDVGGDVLAHGDEPGLASPLCDAIVLAAALFLQMGAARPESGPAWHGEVIAAVYGPGCDGEHPPHELVEAAAEVVPTEASLQAARCARGERGSVPIRGGRRSVELTPLGALTFFFDPAKAATAGVPLATAVAPAADLDEAHQALVAMGVSTELELERARARAELDAGARE